MHLPSARRLAKCERRPAGPVRAASPRPLQLCSASARQVSPVGAQDSHSPLLADVPQLHPT
eukprot:1259414-Prorocentrum_lima.AAC.1